MPGLMYPETAQESRPEASAPLSSVADPCSTLEPPHDPRKHRPLPFWLRVVVLLVGWVVLLVGVAGLVLPGIQGIVTILLGAAILSVASELAHRWMKKTLQRWPKVWNRIDGFREKIHDRLHRMVR